jgi:hypothetical protein
VSAIRRSSFATVPGYRQGGRVTRTDSRPEISTEGGERSIRSMSFLNTTRESGTTKVSNEQIINATKSIGSAEGKLYRREQLGGMLNYSYPDAT